MKRLILIGIVSGALLGGCQGTVKDDDDPSGLEHCHDACEDSAECSVDYSVRDCKSACEDAAQTARQTGCRDEFDAVAECGAENFSCESDGSACASLSREWLECVAEGPDDDPDLVAVQGGCEAICVDAGECGTEGFSLQDCQTSCQDAREVAASAGCLSEYQALVACTRENYTCAGTSSACEPVTDTFVECVVGE